MWIRKNIQKQAGDKIPPVFISQDFLKFPINQYLTEIFSLFLKANADYPKATSKIIMIRNPAITPNVPVWECSPKWASGISSSTTT